MRATTRFANQDEACLGDEAEERIVILAEPESLSTGPAGVEWLIHGKRIPLPPWPEAIRLTAGAPWQ
jgi:hypothetical protein